MDEGQGMMAGCERERATPRLGLAVLARSTFAVDAARGLADRAYAALQRLGLPLVGTAELLMDEATAAGAAESLATQEVDLLVLLSATFSDASAAVTLAERLRVPVCLWALPEPGPVGDRLWLNSLCGSHIAAHALNRLRVPLRYLYGPPEAPETLAPLLPFARAAATRQRLRRSRIGLLGEAPTGFYGCEYDGLALARVIGTEVTRFDLAATFAAAEAAPESAVGTAVRSTLERSPSLATLDRTEVHKFGQAYATLHRAAEERGLDGFAVRCWPEFPAQFGIMPCATLGRLADDGLICACEADVNGAVTMLALQWLAGKPPLLTDIVALDPDQNAVTLWHCGNGPACLARDGAEPCLTLHCNRRIGVAGDFAIRAGQATVCRLGVGPDGYRLLWEEGALLDLPDNRFAGNTALFRPDGSAQGLLDELILGGWEHHLAVVEGRIGAELNALAQMLGIELVHA